MAELCVNSHLGEKRMKGKGQLGWGIFVVSFIVIIIVNKTIYNGVWPSSLPIVLLVTTAFYFRTDEKEKRRIPYWLVILLFLAVLYLSLPKFTYNQAQEIVMKNYGSAPEKTLNIPVLDPGFKPFALTAFYSFKVRNSEEEIRVMVNPNTGEVVVLH